MFRFSDLRIQYKSSSKADLYGCTQTQECAARLRRFGAVEGVHLDGCANNWFAIAPRRTAISHSIGPICLY